MEEIKIRFSLDSEDFLIFQLFAASKGKRHKRNLMIACVAVSIAPAMILAYMITQQKIMPTIYWGAFTLLIIIFSPRYFKWRNKSFYRNYIKKHYSDSFGKPIEVTIGEGEIFTKDSSHEERFQITDIHHVDEITTHLFLFLKTGIALIIPKKNLDIETVRASLQKIGIEIRDNRDWYW